MELMKENQKSSRDISSDLTFIEEKIDIPDEIVQKWQKIVNIIAKVIQVPAALIMRVDPPYLEVFRSSISKNNPYTVGDREHWTGLYCECVLKTNKELLIPNALKDLRWDKNPDIKLGMISYFGVPLFWPKGEAFGTVCVLDSKENEYSIIYKDLLIQFKDLIEVHLELLWEGYKRNMMHEESLLKEKLTVLGQLAAGVAHELRNPLSVIKNTAYILNMILKEPETEVKESIQLVEREVAASEGIIDSLLEFASPKSLELIQGDINDVIRISLTRINIPENIEIAIQLGEKVPRSILIDPDRLTLAFGNIITNALQSMHEGGQLVIKSEVQIPNRVAITFTDTGVGIPEKNLDQLFEPLFTTKAKGIGLGLAVSKTLVEAHGGSIEVQSKLGKGSTFKVRLPILAEESP